MIPRSRPDPRSRPWAPPRGCQLMPVSAASPCSRPRTPRPPRGVPAGADLQLRSTCKRTTAYPASWPPRQARPSNCTAHAVLPDAEVSTTIPRNRPGSAWAPTWVPACASLRLRFLAVDRGRQGPPRGCQPVPTTIPRNRPGPTVGAHVGASLCQSPAASPCSRPRTPRPPRGCQPAPISSCTPHGANHCLPSVMAATAGAACQQHRAPRAAQPPRCRPRFRGIAPARRWAPTWVPAYASLRLRFLAVDADAKAPARGRQPVPTTIPRNRPGPRSRPWASPVGASFFQSPAASPCSRPRTPRPRWVPAGADRWRTSTKRTGHRRPGRRRRRSRLRRVPACTRSSIRGHPRANRHLLRE